MDCEIIEATHTSTNASTQTWTSSSETHQVPSTAPPAVSAKKRKYDPERTTEIKIFPDHQANQSNPQHSEATQHALPRGTRKATWTPQQSYDNKGSANFHENSVGVVLTSPSGHPYCAYCRTTSHPRSTCPMRAKHQPLRITTLPARQKYGLSRSTLIW